MKCKFYICLFMFYLNLLCRPSDLQFIHRLQGLLVPLAGVWMSVNCPGAWVYNPDGRRSHLVPQLTLGTSVPVVPPILVRPFSVVAHLTCIV